MFQESSSRLAMGAAFGATPPKETVLTLSPSLMQACINKQTESFKCAAQLSLIKSLYIWNILYAQMLNIILF